MVCMYQAEHRLLQLYNSDNLKFINYSPSIGGTHQCSGILTANDLHLHIHTRSHRCTKLISANASKSQCTTGTMSQCGENERWRWDTGWVGSPRLSLCGSETSVGGSSWTQRTDGDLENELLTECPDYWCLHSYEYCGWCRLNHSVPSSYSDEYSALFPFGSGMRILLAHLSNRKPLFSP